MKKATTIYFPKSLHSAIKEMASGENRSFNQQVITLLKKSIAGQDAEDRRKEGK